MKFDYQKPSWGLYIPEIIWFGLFLLSGPYVAFLGWKGGHTLLAPLLLLGWLASVAATVIDFRLRDFWYSRWIMYFLLVVVFLYLWLGKSPWTI